MKIELCFGGQCYYSTLEVECSERIVVNLAFRRKLVSRYSVLKYSTVVTNTHLALLRETTRILYYRLPARLAPEEAFIRR